MNSEKLGNLFLTEVTLCGSYESKSSGTLVNFCEYTLKDRTIIGHDEKYGRFKATQSISR